MMDNNFTDNVGARTITKILLIIALVGIISVFLASVFGCAEIPDREMDEHFMNCVMIDGDEAFCG